MGIKVTGGAGGTRAFLDDLVGMSHLLRTAVATLTQAEHLAELGRLQIGGCSGLDMGPQNHRLDDILAALSGPSSVTRHAATSADALAFLAKFAADAYANTDNGLMHMFTSALSSLPVALVKGGGRLLTTGNPIDAVQQVLTADPELVNLAADASPLPQLVGPASELCDDGYPIVTETGIDDSCPAMTPPRSLNDIVSGLAERNDGASGEISVSFVVASDGSRHAIVDIPGTKSWSPGHTSDITSLATNLRAIQGRPTSYEQGVLDAMSEAGVTSHDDVMLVGHSEGGMVAVDAARDAAVSGQFHVSHVVTAGAPIGKTVGSLPHTVQVLALEDRGDVVPRLDGADNPDRPNITTVSGGPDHGSIGANHNLSGSYLPLARSVDASDNVSVRQFMAGAAGFLDDESMVTERFVITRGY